MGCWKFVKQHAYGDEETLPDHSRLAWMLALITINMDLSVPVMYTAIIETSYGCDVSTLYGIFYGLSQANFVMPIVCGWLVDFLGSWSHMVLIICSVFLSMLQVATLFTTSIWLLGGIFLARQWIINQAVVQSYKLMAIRTHKTYNDDEEKKEQECQRTGATADFWTSIGEATVYVVVYFLPSQVSRYVLVFIAVASTIVVAVISATYRQQDLLHKDELPDADRVGEGGKRRSTLRISNAAEADTLLTSGGSSWDDTRRRWCSCEEASMPYRALQYILGAKEFFTNFMIFIPFMHYLMLQLFRAVVTLPLNINEASALPSAVPGVCDGFLKNIYVQGFFSQVFYLIGSILYLRFVALLAPYNYFQYVYTGMAILFGGLATVFYFNNVNVYVGSTVLAVMNAASYYGTEFDTWYLMAVVDDKQYGYFTVVSGIGLSLTSFVSSAFLTLSVPNWLVLASSQGLAALTVLMSVCFAVLGRQRLKSMGHGFEALDGDAEAGARKSFASGAGNGHANGGSAGSGDDDHTTTAHSPSPTSKPSAPPPPVL